MRAATRGVMREARVGHGRATRGAENGERRKTGRERGDGRKSPENSAHQEGRGGCRGERGAQRGERRGEGGDPPAKQKTSRKLHGSHGLRDSGSFFLNPSPHCSCSPEEPTSPVEEAQAQASSSPEDTFTLVQSDTHDGACPLTIVVIVVHGRK